MKKGILISIVFIIAVLLASGCSAKQKGEAEIQKLLLCRDNYEKYVFDFDDNNNVKSIYYENNFDFNDYFSEDELEEYEMYTNVIQKMVEERIIHCDNLKYACNSKYENYFISNKIYVDDFESARYADLGKYYGINKVDVRTKMVANESLICEEIVYEDKYIVEGNKTEILTNNKEHESNEDKVQEVDKPKYYKEYTLITKDDKKATITFKDNGICKIDLSEFNTEVFGGAYCDKEKHKKLYKTTYLEGNCMYQVNQDYYFDITYDGQYESGSYCESYDDKSHMILYDVVDNPKNLIKIQFDETYSSFEFLNGDWKTYDLVVPLKYK